MEVRGGVQQQRQGRTVEELREWLAGIGDPLYALCNTDHVLASGNAALRAVTPFTRVIQPNGAN